MSASNLPLPEPDVPESMPPDNLPEIPDGDLPPLGPDEVDLPDMDPDIEPDPDAEMDPASDPTPLPIR